MNRSCRKTAFSLVTIILLTLLGVSPLFAAAPADWQTPTGMQNQMVLYAQAFNGSTQVAFEDGSKLSVWLPGGSIAGVTDIIDGPLGKLFSCTVFSNSTSVSGMTVKVYDAATDQVYDMQETFNFSSGSDEGSFFAPTVFTVAAGSVNTYTVTFLPGEHGSITSGDTVQQVDEGQAASAPQVTADDGWIFTGWDLSFSNVTADLTVTAQYQQMQTYTVTFDAGEHGVITGGDAVQQVDHGQAATEPAIAAQTGWIFIGWDRSFSYVTSDMTATAEYEQATGRPDWQNPTGLQNSMTVYAKVELNGQPIGASEGSMISAWTPGGSIAGVTDVFEGPAGMEYMMTVFSNSSYVSNMTLKVYDAASDTIYKTQETFTFRANQDLGTFLNPYLFHAVVPVKTYTVTFQAGAHGTITGGQSSQLVVEGGSAAEPQITADYGWDHAGWDKTFDNITADLTVTALYNPHQWTVTFVPGDHGSLSGESVVSVPHQGSAVAPQVNAQTGWIFTGWDKNFDSVTQDMTVTARYQQQTFTVTFNAGTNGSITSGEAQQEVGYGEAASAPTVTPAPGWIFDGWDRSFDNITSDTTVNAKYKTAAFTVVFDAGTHGLINGSRTQSQAVNYGDDAAAPQVDAAEGWIFDGWQGDYTNITADITIYAVYTPVPMPDIAADSVSEQIDAAVNESIDLDFAISNTGDLATGDFLVELQKYSGGYWITVTGSRRTVGSLLPGASTVESYLVVAAGEFASDQYRISCDPVLAVAESNEDNNISAVKTVTVKMPELEVQSLVVSPANCVSQQTVTASAWFMNTGNKTVSAVGAVYVKKQGSWTKLNEKSWEFAPSVRQNLTADISGYPNGQYEFKAVIDEADAVEEINETNNIKDGVILTIADPDLKITSVSAQSESVLPSQVTTLKINILNDSASACSDSFTVAVEIGAGEGVWSSLGQFSVPGIGGSQEIAVDFEYTAPADFGSYQFRVTADSAAQVTESNETNNQLVGASITVEDVDLVITDTFVGGNGKVGTPFDVNWTVLNAGQTRSNFTTWKDHVYISTSPDFSQGGKRIIGTDVLSNMMIESGGSYDGFASCQFVNGDEGTRYIFISLNNDGALVETDRGNNIAGPFAVEILPADKADLYPVSLYIPAIVEASQQCQISWTAVNQGNSVTSNSSGILQSSWYDKLYLSSDSNLSQDDIVLGEAMINNSVEAGSNYSKTKIVTIPASLSEGQYYVIAVLDSRNNVAESQETNNTIVSSSAFTVTAGQGDTTGPWVTGISLSGTLYEPFASLEITFSEQIDASTLTADDITLASSSDDSIDISGISPVDGSGGCGFVISFAEQNADNNYVLRVGPSISDTSANRMDQDRDNINGEGGDYFEGRFSLQVSTGEDTIPPYITSVYPLSFVDNVDYIYVQFSEPMDGASIDYADFILVDDQGNEYPGIGSAFTGSSTYKINFSYVDIPGDYTLNILPYMADAYGNLLDQDADGTGGQIPADVYLQPVTLTQTVDNTPPYFIGIDSDYFETPAASITAVFSEAVVFGSGDISITDPDGYNVAITSVVQNSAAPNRYAVNFVQQSIEGIYSVNVSADNITDDAGNSLQQSWSGQFIIDLDGGSGGQSDTSGPVVVDVKPDYEISEIEYLEVYFNEAIDRNSLQTTDFTLVDPTGAPVAINDIIKYSDKVYRVFPAAVQSRLGGYTFTVLPEISDLSGNLMNQNQNDVNGEASADRYIQSVEIIGYTDLEIASYDISTVAVSGQQLAVNIEVVNNGLGALYDEIYTGGWSDRIVLSRDMIYGNSDDITLGTYDHGGDLSAGGSYVIDGNVNVPEWVFGNFNLIVKIDRNGSIAELEKDDNVMMAPIRVRTVDVGLSGSDITYMPLAPDTQSGFIVSANIHNYSEQAAVADVYFYDGSETDGGLIATLTNVEIGARSQRVVSAPNYTTDIEGGHKLTVVLKNISPADRISSNNKASRYIVVGPKAYELTVSMDSFECWPGASLDIPVTIRNTGANPLNINSVAITGEAQSWFTPGNDVSASLLGVGESITVLYSLDVPADSVQTAVELLTAVTVNTAQGSFSDQAMVELLPEPEASIEVTLLDEDTNAVLRGAMVMIEGNSETYYTDYYGMATIPAAAGSTKLYFYAENHHPKAVEINAAPGSNSLTQYLEEGLPLEVQSVSVRPLTAQEIADRGVNLSDPDNYWVYDFELSLGLNSSGSTTGGSGSFVVPSVPMPLDISEPVTFRRYIPANEITEDGSTTGYTVIGHIKRYSNPIDPEARVETYIIIPGDVRFAKEFFDVTTVIINNAQAPNPEDIIIQNSTATIDLPSGISLPELFGAPQSASVLLSDDGILTAGEKAQATWTIRGDFPGKYIVSVDATGNIQPFDIDLYAHGESDEFEVTYPSYYMTIDYPDEVYKDQPFDLDIYIENTNTVPLNFATVKLDTYLMKNAYLAQGVDSSRTIAEILPQETGKFTFTMISEVNGRVVVKETAMEEKLFIEGMNVSIAEPVAPVSGGIAKGEPFVVSAKGFEGFVEVIGAVADAGQDSGCYVGEQVTLDGSASSDCDQYRWSVVSRPQASTAEITNASNAVATFVPDAAGQYVFKLEVASGGLWGQSDTVTVIADNQYFTVAASAGSFGSIDPAGSSNVLAGDDITFSITPNTGYYISDVIVDGLSQGAVSSYTFYDVRENHTIEALFQIHTYEVTFAAGEHGSLNGDTQQVVSYGSAATAPSVNPDYGWDFAGWDVGFDNVTSNLTVTATYSRHEWTVTFLAGDHGTLSGDTTQQVAHESGAVAPSVTPAHGWDFAGWDVGFDNVTSNLTVTATYSRHEWTVTFLAGDHGTLSGDTTQQVAHESGAAAPSVTPAHGWDFAGWDVDFNNVTSNLTVTATYSRHEWTVIFLAGDHGTLSGDTTQQVSHESGAAAPSVTPAYGWDFAGWDVGFDSVTSNLTVTATYSRHEWTVTFLAGDHGTLSGDTAQQVAHESGAVAPSVTPAHGWDFAGWDTDFDNVTGDLTVTAAYTRHIWTVTFSAGAHGSISGQAVQQIEHEGRATAPGLNAAEGWTFTGWDAEFDIVTSDITVTAQYEAITYTVAFSAGDHGMISSGVALQTVTHGEAALAPEIIADHGWDFAGWSVNFDAVKSDLAVTAVYTPHVWTVTFSGGEHGSLEGQTLQQVVNGSSALAPKVISDQDWCFAGWDTQFDPVNEDIIVTAVYLPMSMELADFNGDNIIDRLDLFILVDQWLIDNCQYDIHADQLVNLTDYAIFSGFWLESGTVSLDLSLVAGWNWISFNVLPDGAAIDTVLADYAGIARNQDIIVADDGKNATYYEGKWYGTLKVLQPGKMYKLRSHWGGDMTVEGSYVDDTIAINLIKGWNWLGYCPPEAMPLSDALANLVVSDGDYVVSPAGQNATYWGGNWYGTLKQLVPGYGYMLKLKSDTSFSYTSAAKAKSFDTQSLEFAAQDMMLMSVEGFDPLEAVDGLDWVSPQGKPYSMLVYTDAALAGVPLGAADKISFWNGHELLGVAEISESPAGDIFAATVFGEQPQISGLTIKLYIASTGEIIELEQTVDFAADTTAGSLDEPISLDK